MKRFSNFTFIFICLMTVLVTCQVTIAGNKFPLVSEVDISSSWKENGDFANIKMPHSIKFSQKNIQEIVKRGDEITIQLGYEGELHTVFNGYVATVKPETPIEILCEDGIFKLKQAKVANRFFDNANLREVIQHIAPDYYVEKNVRDVKIGDFMIKDATAAKVLQVIREEFGLPSFFRDGVLYSGASYFGEGTRHDFSTDKTIRETGLQYSTGEAKLLVKCVGILANGSKVSAEHGDSGGEVRTFLYNNINSKAELLKLAKERHSNIRLDGYSGNFMGWGEPRALHGDVAVLNDVAFNGERTGSYMIDGLKIRFSTTLGYQRTYTLGAKTT